MKRQIISTVLVICMLLTLIPSAAAYTDNKADTNSATSETPGDSLTVDEGEASAPEAKSAPATRYSSNDVAYAVKGGNIYFDKSTGTITDCDSSVTAASIPSKIIGVAVTSIGGRAFGGCTSLTSVSIGDSVTSIGKYAFYHCKSLTSVRIPDSVTSVGEYAFEDCTNLTSVTIGGGVTTVDKSWGFKSCTSLKTVTICDGVTSIGDSAFQYCRSLTSVTIPDSVTSIGGSSFYDCKSLTSVTIPDSVTIIGDGAFYNCTSLKSVTIGNGVTSIGGSAFYNCTSLSSVTIGNSVTSIGGSAFYNCTSLSSVTIGNSVTSIGGSAFYGCTSLTSVTIPDSVTSIGGAAFYSCTSLTSVTIPDSVTSIGEYTFDSCRSLTSVTIGNAVTSIGKHAFHGCPIKSITFPESLTTIGNYAFYSHKITEDSVIFPESLISIGDYAFRGSIDNLKNIYFLGDAPQIGESVFSSNVTIYYLEWKNDWWTPTWNGYPTVTWVPEHEHDYVAVVSEPTCTEGGYTTYTCSFCFDTYRIDFASPIGHNYGEVVTEPTCTERGYTTHTCSNCGDVYNDTYIDATGHSYDEGVVTTPATETTDGVMTYTCSVCGHEKTEILGATGIPFTVTFVVPDGVSAVAAIDGNSNDGIILPTAGTPGDGYTFLGWTTAALTEDVTTAPTYFEAESEYNNGTATLYALYSYLQNSPNGDYVKLNSTPDDLAGIYLIVFEKNGWIFDGSLTKLDTEDNYQPVTITGDTISAAQGDAYSFTIGTDGSILSKSGLYIGRTAGSNGLDTSATAIANTITITNGTASITSGTTRLQFNNSTNQNRFRYYKSWQQDIQLYRKTIEFTEATCYTTECGCIHTWNEGVATQSTCIERGAVTFTCTKCGDTYAVFYDNALGHDIIHHHGKAATCTQNGWEAYDTCSRCDYTTYQEVPATGHSYTTTVTAPTCTEKGYTTYTCTCGDSYVDDYVAALGHNIVTDLAVPATCTETGLTEGCHCSRCDYKVAQNTVAALGHDEIHHDGKTATCTENGWEAYVTCSRCDYTTYKEIEATGHNYESVITEPTCTEGGYTTYICYCGSSYKDNYTSALGHNYVNGVCDRCGAKDPDYKPDDPVEPKPTVSFSDVTGSEWFAQAVNYAVSNGLMNGMGNNKFEPNTGMTRAMLVTVLWRYAGEPVEGENTFTDLTQDWYIPAVTWAAHNGIVGGVGNGKFDPDGNVTREQLATILFRYCNALGLDTSARADLSAFPDAGKVSAYAEDALSWAVAVGLVTGTQEGGKTYLDPLGNATRAQVATILMRYIENVLK